MKGGWLCVDLVVALGEPERGTAQLRDYLLPFMLSAPALVLPVAALVAPISPVIGFGHVSAAAVLCAPLHRRMGTNAILNMNYLLNILIYSQIASPSSLL